MTGFADKIKSINYVVMSTLLHSSAIIALTVGPMYFPEMMGNHQEKESDTIEFTVMDEGLETQIEPVAAVAVPAAPKPEPIVEPVEHAPAPAPKEEVSKSNQMPDKDAVVAAKVDEKKEAQAEQVAQQETVEAEETPEPLAEESEILTQQQLEQQEREEQAKQQLEEQLAAAEAARAAEQAEIEQLRQEQERLAEEKAQAKAEAEAAEAARIQAEEDAAKALAEQKALAEKEKQEAIAAAKQAAAAKAAADAAAAAKKAKGAGNGERIVVDQDFLQLRQKPGNVPPKYTSDMRLKKMEGSGQAVYFVDKAGNVKNIRLTKSTGHPELDNEIVSALSKYKFVPGQSGDTVHNIEFRLKGPAQPARGRLRARN